MLQVLAKFPVIQHVLFGSLLPLVVAPIPKSDLEGRKLRLSRESIPKPQEGLTRPLSLPKAEDDKSNTTHLGSEPSL